MPPFLLKFAGDFVGAGAARARVLPPAMGYDPDVLLGGSAASDLRKALPSGCFGRHGEGAQASHTLPWSMVCLVLGRLAVPHGDELAEAPLCKWLMDLPALIVLYEKITLRGFLWDGGFHDVEDLTAALDIFMAGVPDVIDFRMELKATRQVELPSAAVTVGEDEYAVLMGVLTAQVLTMDQPLGKAASALFHLSSPYRWKARMYDDFRYACVFIKGSFLVKQPAGASMPDDWIMTQALHWWLHADLAPNLYHLADGASPSALMRLLDSLRAKPAEQARSFSDPLEFYIRDGGPLKHLFSVLADPADGHFVAAAMLVTRMQADPLPKDKASLPFGLDLLHELELALSDRIGMLNLQSRTLGTVNYLVDTEKRSKVAANTKGDPTGEFGGLAPVQTQVKQLYGDVRFQKGIACLEKLVTDPRAAPSDFLRVAFESQCMALIKHFLGRRKLLLVDVVLTECSAFGLSSFHECNMTPLSTMLLSTVLDLQQDENGDDVLPAELAAYEISSKFLVNLISGCGYGDAQSCDFLCELVYRPNQAQYHSVIPSTKGSKNCSAAGYVEMAPADGNRRGTSG